MTLRNALLAVLTLGPAYGYQLHAEVVERTRREAPLNVGQVYSTLDRLRRDGLVDDAGVTPDNLPLYALTEAGGVDAHAYLTEPEQAEWSDMVERVLLALSLPGTDAATLIARYRSLWEMGDSCGGNTGVKTDGTGSASDPPADPADPAGGVAQTPALQAAQHARQLQSAAAITWLDSLPSIEPWPLRTDRRRRGRRSATRHGSVQQ